MELFVIIGLALIAIGLAALAAENW